MRKKINAAKDALVEGKSTSEIAINLGFSSASHLGKAFKAVCGITPAEYVSNVKIR
jgi:AraC-like DNA-binding protein